MMKISNSTDSLIRYFNAFYIHNDPDAFQQLIRIFDTISTADDLHRAIALFENYPALPQWKQRSETMGGAFSSFAAVIQNKISTLLLSHGNIPEATYLYLYPLFSLSIIEPSDLLSRHIRFLRQHYETLEKKTSDEAVLIKNIVAVLSITNAAPSEGLSFYLESSMLQHLPPVITPADELFFVHNYLQKVQFPPSELFPVLQNIFIFESIHKRSAEKQRSILNWTLHVFWNLPLLYNHSEWKQFYAPWKELLHNLLMQENIEHAMYLHFFLYHILGNSFQTREEWKDFNDTVDIPCADTYRAWGKKHRIPKCRTIGKKEKRIKLAFIKDRIVQNSPFKVEYSLLKTLLNDTAFCKTYDVVLFSMDYFEKSKNEPEAVAMLENLGIQVITTPSYFSDQGYYHSHLEKALWIRDQILHHEIDILIALCNNYDILDFLFANRSAPKQIFWSHGNFEYDIPNIDKKITHFVIPKEKTEEYTSFSIPFSKENNNPFIESDIITNERSKYPSDVLILGTIGRLLKMDSDIYLKTIADIMHQNPHTIYLACGPGDHQTLKQKSKMLGLEGRFYFPGMVDAHLYGHIIDIWLDTFPLQGGQSISEFMSKGKPLLYMADLSKLTENHAAQHMEVVNDVSSVRPYAIDIEDYKNLSNRLIHDLAYRQSLAETTAEIVESWHSHSVTDFLNILDGLYA